MLFNNRKLNSVPLLDKEVNLSQILRSKIHTLYGPYNACSMGQKTPQNCPFPLALHHPAGGPSHGDRQHAQKYGKYHTCGLGDMLTNRQTDTHIHRRAHYNTLPPLMRAK